MAATNRLDIIDPALLRPGRFDEVLLVPSPETAADHKAVLAVHTRRLPLGQDVDLDRLAELSFGAKLSGAEVASLCREAATLALRVDITSAEVSMEQFEEAITRFRSSDFGSSCFVNE